MNKLTCENFLRSCRWPGNQFLCPVCGSADIVEITTRKTLRCRDCRKQFSVRFGTLFDNSPLELRIWFKALSLVLDNPDITCQSLADKLSVTLRTAWQVRRKLLAGLSLINTPGNFEDTLKQLLTISKSQIHANL